MNIKEKAKELKIMIPTIFIALQRKETPLLAKIFAAMTVAYALSPIDFIPDFIPILGYLDDIIILPILIYFTLKFLPKNILDECKVEAIELWKNGKPKKWYYAIPIILVWIFIIFLVVRKFC